MNTYLKRIVKKKSPWEKLISNYNYDQFRRNRNNNDFLKKAGLIGGITAAGTALIAAYPLLLRPWYMHWGAKDDEIRRYMPGDEKVEKPDYITTRAITIHAKPEQIWPWLIETGFEQNGLGIYEWLDKMFGYKSKLHVEASKRVNGELSEESKKAISLSKNLPVQKLEQYQNIVLGRQFDNHGWTLAIGLYPINKTTTRLIIRTRVRLTKDVRTRTLNLFMDPAFFVMIRKWLYNVKNQAEINAEEEYEEAESVASISETESKSSE